MKNCGTAVALAPFFRSVENKKQQKAIALDTLNNRA